MPSLCNLFLQQYSLHYLQTLHNDCSHIEDMHLPFSAHLINMFAFLTGVELRQFLLPSCLGVLSLCNLKLQQFSFLYIQTLHNDCSHIEDVHLLFVHIS